MDWQAVGLSLRLSAWHDRWCSGHRHSAGQLAHKQRLRGIIFVETLVSLPIVLPPTVIGFYLLMLMAPQQPLGRPGIVFGHPLPFSFAGPGGGLGAVQPAVRGAAVPGGLSRRGRDMIQWRWRWA